MERIGQAIDVRRFLKFGIVGISGLLVNMGLLYLGHEVGHLPLLLASALAVETAIINNFIWNNYWTFAQRSMTLRRLARFNLVSLGGLAINLLILYVLVDGAGIYYLVANLFAVAAATSWNFLFSTLWTWGG